jgi:glutamate synthase (NADPH/NADH) small chain
MEEEGVKFVTNINVGVDITAEQLLKDYDRVLLCCGASHPRDIKVPGRDAKGIYFAVDFLKQVTKSFWIQILQNSHMSLQKENTF